ncbi:queuosine precursor transporter [Piscirickettsia salmonis]|uniref:queuosine precursor transporter n=1 Tax=Piscirickettsia salmonis TaxID=1238 RepID=UPI0007C8FAE7|nr:hypothetical protein A0O36_01707 [Piscirickettsiaceae bacterium NZ-RLO1]
MIQIKGKNYIRVMTDKTPMKFFHIICMIYISSMLSVNFLTLRLMPIAIPFTDLVFPIGGGVLLFPIGFLLQDITTEVYGYARSRQLMWLGIIAMALSVTYSSIIIHQPYLPEWTQNHNAFIGAFGNLPTHTFGNIMGLITGSIVNDYILSKSKIKLDGNLFALRCISATLIGDLSYQLVSYLIAWTGEMSMTKSILPFFIFALLYKITFNIVTLPISYITVEYLKKKENIDIYDTKTNFNPFKFTIT